MDRRNIRLSEKKEENLGQQYYQQFNSVIFKN